MNKANNQIRNHYIKTNNIFSVTSNKNTYLIAPGNESSKKTLERSPSNANSKNRCVTPTNTTNVTAIQGQQLPISANDSNAGCNRDRSEQVFATSPPLPSPTDRVVIPPVNIICAPPSINSQSHPSPYLDNP